MEKNSIHIMETMTGAKALMTAMEKEGVKEVFGFLEVQTFPCMMNFHDVILDIF